MFLVLKDILYPLLWAVFAVYLIGKWRFFRVEGVPVNWLRYGFCLKLLAGIGIWALYTFHYTYRAESDAYGYFDDAMILNSYLLQDPSVWFRFMFGIGLDQPDLTPVFEKMTRWTFVYTYGIANDNPTIIRCNMLIGLFSFGSYHVHTVFFNFLALIGLTGFLRFIQSFRPQFNKTISARWTAACLFLFPTVLLWGSGVLKEALLICFLGLLLLHFRKAMEGIHLRWLAVALLFLLLLYLKPYVIICLAPPLLAFWIVERFGWKSFRVFPVVLLLSYFIAVNADLFFSAGDLLYILQKKQIDFYNLATMNDAGSLVLISPVDQHPLGFLFDSPERITHALFRPYPWELTRLVYLPAFAEILITLGLIVLLLFSAQKGGLRIGSFVFQPAKPAFLWLAFSFLLVFSLVMGSCVPVLGAVVRYKLPVLLFLAGILNLQKRSRSATAIPAES